jgi:hypothetical protein
MAPPFHRATQIPALFVDREPVGRHARLVSVHEGAAVADRPAGAVEPERLGASGAASLRYIALASGLHPTPLEMVRPVSTVVQLPDPAGASSTSPRLSWPMTSLASPGGGVP